VTGSAAELVAALDGRGRARLTGDGSVEVEAITHDSREAAPGVAFACVRGQRADGHEFAPDAVAAGTRLLVVDHELHVESGAPLAQIIVDDVRAALGWLAAEISGNPSRRLTVVGVTGTNGKTTTVALLAAIFEAAGSPPGVIGTLSGRRTTPEAPELQRRLAGFVADGRNVAVMEVSSHALALHRVTGTHFAAAVFTNLGEDHLDLHGSTAGYFRAKAKLFEPSSTALGVINGDDRHGRLLIDAAEIPVVRYGLGDASDVTVTPSTITLTWRGEVLRVPLGGHFNVANIVAAATTASALGVADTAIATGLASVAPIAGRFEHVVVPGAGIDVIVDYAHTPDGLESVLSSAREMVGDDKVVVVFGCGGDRDHQKRPHMGAVAARLADVTVITSDNPRSEDPRAIIDDIVAGVNQSDRDDLVIEPDRRQAIRHAIGLARPGDIVVVAGKGHETTQVIGDETLPFDDRQVVTEALAAQNGAPS
jgi:UDP-N-acetylmuramoyl-L-alanyl-D-glutamate--2,6-diaminopimelate ligase